MTSSLLQLWQLSGNSLKRRQRLRSLIRGSLISWARWVRRGIVFMSSIVRGCGTNRLELRIRGQGGEKTNKKTDDKKLVLEYKHSEMLKEIVENANKTLDINIVKVSSEKIIAVSDALRLGVKSIETKIATMTDIPQLQVMQSLIYSGHGRGTTEDNNEKLIPLFFEPISTHLASNLSVLKELDSNFRTLMISMFASEFFINSYDNAKFRELCVDRILHLQGREEAASSSTEAITRQLADVRMT
ncbi:unnamed protein product [Polarella glacialis]|uniref:Uncharacterized protein n=1 Tax=Polarella glacialis TaxID=89957 RepID=A0A813J124_POLGL|nr:unnamed protein product [Polarella glacialis]